MDLQQLMACGKLYLRLNGMLLHPHNGDLLSDPIHGRRSIATKGADETSIVATQDRAGTRLPMNLRLAATGGETQIPAARDMVSLILH